MPDEAQPEFTSDVTAEDSSIAFSGPAHLANQFFVALGPAGVRIAFCEQESAETSARFRRLWSFHFGTALPSIGCCRKRCRSLRLR